jgi:steroid 5-alpha reductase family enzyme
VSGVALLEQTIADRRPGYADYVRRTSAFLPLPPRKPSVTRARVDLGA